MTTPQTAPPTPQTVRVIHGAMCAGMILFAVVAHFFIRPTTSGWQNLTSFIPLFLGLALAACVASLLLSTRVPRPSDAESAESFWKKAGQSALMAWAFLEGAGLLSIVVYSQTGSTAAITVAAVAILLFALLNPRYFEGR